MSLPEALLKWLSLANSHDSGLTALQVSDGIVMSQVLHKIDPKHFTEVRI
jgi:HOOK domain